MGFFWSKLAQRVLAAIQVFVLEAVESDALPGRQKIGILLDEAVELFVDLLRSPEKAIEIHDAELGDRATRCHFGYLIELQFRVLEVARH